MGLTSLVAGTAPEATSSPALEDEALCARPCDVLTPQVCGDGVQGPLCSAGHVDVTCDVGWGD